MGVKGKTGDLIVCTSGGIWEIWAVQRKSFDEFGASPTMVEASGRNDPKVNSVLHFPTAFQIADTVAKFGRTRPQHGRAGFRNELI